MSSKSFPLLSLVALLVLVSTLALQPKVGASPDTYYPTGYDLLGATAYVSGELTDLQSDDGAYMAFRSYASQTSAQTLYAHQETTTIAGTGYYLSRLESAETAGIDLSASMASTGRKLWGKFVYSLSGVTSIPASTWTVYYRAWHSSVPENVSINSPSSVPAGIWKREDNAYSSDDAYASTSNDGATQQYGNYGFNIPPTASVTKVEVGYEAYTDGNEKIGITLSWNNGITWATEYVSNPLETTDPDTPTWIDFTNATNWTSDKLSDANFRTRAKCVVLGLPSDVYLDWIPVRVTYIILPSAHADVDILIRKSDGTIRQTIATDVATSRTSLSTRAQTLSGTYSWAAYTVVDETDYLEIDYYLDVTTANTVVTAYLRIDDNNLHIKKQTRATDILLPSEYTVEVEFTGSSDTYYWSQLIWAVDGAWTTDNVSVTLQLYDYTLGAYPTSGDGYIAYTSSTTSNTDETKSQTITTNPTNFRDASGNWKMKIKGAKSTTLQFDFKADLIKYEVTSVAPSDVAVLNVTVSPTSVYPGDIFTINVTVKNEGETTETFNVTVYYDNTQIGKQTVSSLAPAADTTLTFNWNTTGVLPGEYTIKAMADTVSGETDTVDNIFINGIINVLMFYVHDVTVASVTPSSTEVYVGQIVDIFVVVRNEGNANETFNITLYYDSTAIGTQTVTDLEPRTETTLKFSWNTTEVTPDIGYTIKAEASAVAGETDTVDNTFTYDNVRVKSQVTSLPFDWSPILPFLIPILFGALGFVVVGIIRKKEVGQGFEFFNEMTDGGIPDAYSVMIIGGAGSGKSVLCQQLAYNYLTQGKSCVYVTYDIFPFEVRQNMKNFQWDISTYEQEGTFKFVDSYSAMAGLNSEEKYYVEQPFSLSDLGITMSAAISDVKHKSIRVFLDSTAPLFARVDPSKVTEFLQDRSARIKGDNGAFFFTVGEGTVPSDLRRRLEEIVDCIIELDVYEGKGKTWKRMRVRKLRGRKVPDAWMPFKIEVKKGITFFPPKGWSKSRKS